MHYLIRVEKTVDCLPRPGGDGPPTRCPKLAYVKGVKDLRGRGYDDDDRREELEEAVEEHGIELDPKWPLQQTETIHAVPNIQIGPQKRRLEEAVYNGEISIPEKLVDKHDKLHQQYYRRV